MAVALLELDTTAVYRVGRVYPIDHAPKMRRTPIGIEFTCEDLIEAGVMTECCPGCHGWDEWEGRAAGLVEHDLPNGNWLLCCCGYRAGKSDQRIIQKLNAWRRAVRRARR